MGNKLEAPVEGTWGPGLESWNFKVIKEAGFDSIRLPVRWTRERASGSPPYTIGRDFLTDRLQWAVDMAIQNNLAVVINMHHYEELYTDPYAEKERFLAIWKQVAEHFRDYPNDKLVFELMNEPHGELNAEIWNEFLMDAWKMVRESNPDRYIMIGPAEWGGLSGMNKLILPEDDKLIFTIHYYEPFKFTHQGAEWSGMGDKCGVRWLGTEQEKQFISGRLNEVAEWAKKRNNIPVYVGEFGVYKRCAFPEDQVRWVDYVTRESEKRNFSWAYWEFNAGFGAHGPNKPDGWNYLLNGLMPDSQKMKIPRPSPEALAAIKPAPSRLKPVKKWAVNCGGDSYTAKDGTGFSGDEAYHNGESAFSDAEIQGTDDDTIYQSERWGQFSYSRPMKKGKYRVTVYLAEIYWDDPGKRVMNITAEGEQVAENIDLIELKGKNNAYTIEFDVTLSDKTLNLGFTASVDSAKVSAIRVSPVKENPVRD